MILTHGANSLTRGGGGGDTEYAMVDADGYLIVDDADNVVVGIDYLTANESFETN
jgi:hypothetical protein